MKKYILLGIILIYLSIVAGQELKIIGLAIFILLAVVVLIATGFGIWIAVERMKILRARRVEAEKQANVMVITNNGQTWIRDTDHGAWWRTAHLDPRTYANGQNTYNDPSQTEIAAWDKFNRPRTIEKTLQLPASTQEPVELMPALDTVQRCLIVGPSDSGKTTILQHIVSRQSSKVVVIDPHGYPNKWQGCTVIGTGRNYQEIDKTLTALVQLMTKRYDEIGKGLIIEGNHPQLTILIDEWRAIIFNLGKPASEAIKALLTESRKASMSIFVASHSERVKPLGIEGEGDLKDGFAVVRLSIVDGVRQATIDTGNAKISALLPGPFQATSQVLDGDDLINLEIEPSATEAAILQLHKQGQSHAKICEQVWGDRNARRYGIIDNTLQRFKCDV